jgi:2-methylisocitrate lyase-like PEP mutase family enzyme
MRVLPTAVLLVLFTCVCPVLAQAAARAGPKGVTLTSAKYPLVNMQHAV